MRFSVLLLAGVCTALAACGGGDLSPQDETEFERGLGRAPEVRRQAAPSVFGDDGLSFGSEGSTLSGIFGGDAEPQGAIPVNRFLWQASLDTLSFLPLSSTDPFTGVIATDWGATPNAPGERFKVTAYMLDGRLSASSLRVAVFREVRTEDGQWFPAQVDPGTPRQIEDAILTRARQIRLAESGGGNTG